MDGEYIVNKLGPKLDQLISVASNGGISRGGGSGGGSGNNNSGGTGGAVTVALPFKQIMTGKAALSELTVLDGAGNSARYQVTFPEPFKDGEIPQVMLQTTGETGNRIQYAYNVTNTGFIYSASYNEAKRSVRWTAFTLDLSLFSEQGVYPK